MKITICGSLAFFEEILQVQKQLQNLGHEVLIPETTADIVASKSDTADDFINNLPREQYLKLKNERMKLHLQKINDSEAILVLNYDKNRQAGYIGANTLIEMGLAFWLNKKIFLYKKPSENLNNFDEIVAMKPQVLDENLNNLQKLI